MSEDNKVKASDVVDLIIEHLDDIKLLKESDYSYYGNSGYLQNKDRSYDQLQFKLDAYVDQRITKKLVELRLLRIVDPMD